MLSEASRVAIWPFGSNEVEAREGIDTIFPQHLEEVQVPLVAMRLKPVRALTLFVMDVDCITLIYSSNEVKSREGIDTRI